MSLPCPQPIKLKTALIIEFGRVGAEPVWVDSAANAQKSDLSVKMCESGSVFRDPVSHKKTDSL